MHKTVILRKGVLLYFSLPIQMEYCSTFVYVGYTVSNHFFFFPFPPLLVFLIFHDFTQTTNNISNKMKIK